MCIRDRGDPSLETDAMVAIETRKPYNELPAAFRYRDATNFKACDAQRYHQRVAELRARTVTPSDMTNAIIPLPMAKPDLDTVSQISDRDAQAQDAVAAAQAVERLAGDLPVRVVGPAFFPAD